MPSSERSSSAAPVVAVLNDLFGIQARSGCFCAGPYLHRLYPVDDAWSAAMHAQARLGRHGATLACARVSLNYYISEAVFDYIVDAVHLIANDGWRLLRLYRFDPGTGLWQHANGPARPPLSLADVSSGSAGRRSSPRPRARSRASSTTLRRIIRALAAAPPPPVPPGPVLSREFERIRWFPLPGEA